MLKPWIGRPVAVKAGSRLTTLAVGTLATVSEARKTAAPAWNASPNPRGTPYSWATNSTARAWNSALPPRLILAPSGRAKLAIVGARRSSPSAASSIVGRVAMDEVVEKPINIEGKAARKKRRGGTRAINATAGR